MYTTNLQPSKRGLLYLKEASKERTTRKSTTAEEDNSGVSISNFQSNPIDNSTDR